LYSLSLFKFSEEARVNTYEAKVRAFHVAMGAAVDEDFSIELLELRKKLLAEEVRELQQEIDKGIAELSERGAVSTPTKANMMKEMADVQYVLSGMAVSFGLPADVAFDRVHESNLSKLDENGKPIKREDGKVLKGPRYHPPVLDDLVGEAA
jgi:predicted HAD superfamily Cof-like phosphohydrolase